MYGYIEGVYFLIFSFNFFEVIILYFISLGLNKFVPVDHLHPFLNMYVYIFMGFPGGSEVTASACNAGDRIQSLGRGNPLEKEMATQSSILAWRIPWMEGPGGLQSTGSQRVGHD